MVLRFAKRLRQREPLRVDYVVGPLAELVLVLEELRPAGSKNDAPRRAADVSLVDFFAQKELDVAVPDRERQPLEQGLVWEAQAHVRAEVLRRCRERALHGCFVLAQRAVGAELEDAPRLMGSIRPTEHFLERPRLEFSIL